MQQRDLERQNEYCIRAQDIITELMSCLDMKQGGEVAQNLFSLYSFTFDRIVQANMEDDVNYLDQAMRVLTDLRESWAEIERTGAGAKVGLANAS